MADDSHTEGAVEPAPAPAPEPEELSGGAAAPEQSTDQSPRQQRRRVEPRVCVDRRHEFAQVVGKSWTEAEWHVRLPYHTPRDTHRSARLYRARAASDRLGARQAKLDADTGSRQALTPQPPARRMTPGQRHLQEAAERGRSPARVSTAAASSRRLPFQQGLRPWTSPHFATAAASLEGVAGPFDFDDTASSATPPAGASRVARGGAEQELPPQPLAPQTSPATPPIQPMRHGGSAHDMRYSSHRSRKVARLPKPADQLIRRQIPLASDGRMDLSPCPFSGKPLGQWSSARSEVVFPAQGRPSARKHAVTTVVAAVHADGSAASAPSPSPAPATSGSRSTGSAHTRTHRARAADTHAASAALRALRRRIGPELRDRPANGWAQQAPASRFHGRGPPRCAPLSPGQNEAVQVSVSRTERIFAAAQSALVGAELDRTLFTIGLGLR